MNILYTLVFLPVVCFGQKDYCKKISKTIDKEKGTITYKSPSLVSISVIKQYKLDTVFVLRLNLYDQSQHFNGMGASVEFDDGTIINEELVRVDCKQEMSVIASGFNSSSANSGEYLLQGFFHINPENIKQLTTHKIVRIRLDRASQTIPERDAMKIMNYILCLSDDRYIGN
jgi:hypothetical protein